MAEIRLIFDSTGQRWEGVILPVDQWTALDQYNELLTIAYSASGELAGFIFDLDVSNSAATAALTRIRELFGDMVADRVSDPDDNEVVGTIVELQRSAIVESTETAVFPVLGSVNARARDVVIVDDASRGVVRISMRLPWWAAFVRPWVTVRRRGRPEVIALGPLRRTKGVHTAELHYGLPTPPSSLVAEVIRGTRGVWLVGFFAAVVTAALLLGGLAIRSDGEPRTEGATLVVVETTVDAANLQQSSSTVVSATTVTAETPIVAETSLPSTTVAITTTQPMVSTTKPPRAKPTTPTTLLPPGGVSFALPSQYITANDTRADVTVDRVQVRRGETLNARVRVSAVFINPFDRPGVTTLSELIAACQALINAEVTVSPAPGWSPNVSLTLVGTVVTGGGFTQLVVIGNIATECGDSLTNTNPPRISVVRTTFYREVPISLKIPANLAAGKYQLVLDNFNLIPFEKATPIEITVTE